MKIHLFLSAIIYALFLSCDSGTNPDDTGNPDTDTTKISHGITGTLTFTGEWPANAAEVRVVTSTVFPPEMDDIIYGNEIPVDTSKYDFEFELAPGTYRFVGLAWRNEGADWNFPGICSYYVSEDDSLSPVSITIADDTMVVKDVDMTVNCSRARIVSAAKITGSVTFNDNWPGEFTEARVIATTRFNIETFDRPTLIDLVFSKSIARGTTACDYEIPAFPGNYLATFVVFFTEDGTISMEDVFYTSYHGGLDITTTYMVELNATAAGPDFAIEF